MIRVLHLLDLDAGEQTQTAARQLAGDRAGGAEVLTRTLGRGGDDATVFSAVVGLRRCGAPEFDLIHAFGPRPLLAAALGSGRPILYTPDRHPRRRDVRLVRAVVASRDVQVIASSDTMRRAFVTRGVPIERCHLIRPAVEFGRIKRRRDAALRQTLQFGPDDFVMLACGESTRETDHRLAVWSAAILHVLDPRYRLLLWGRGLLTEQLLRFAHRMHLPGLLTAAEPALRRRLNFEDLLPATDAILVTATRPAPTLPIATCMAAGLPIVAVVSETVSELLEDRHTALMVGQAKPRLLAQRILDLRRDAGVQWSISDVARTEAYEYFSLTRFLNQHRAVYRQVAEGQTVDVPRQAPGAGLRFHGRA